jgi:hypothetical protein
MNDRERELRALAEEVTAVEGVVDAWTAKSFSDRLFVVEVEAGEELPESVRAELADRDLEGANRAFGIGAEDDAFVGEAGRGERYRFLDTAARGTLRSYVVD